MNRPTIRRVDAEADAASLASLYRAWHAEGQRGDATDPHFEQSFVSWYQEERPRRRAWLAEVDGRTAGFADLEIRVRRPRPGRAVQRWGYLDGMYVLTAHRRTGIGALLVSALLEDADRERLSAVMLHPTGESVLFYERAGFAFEAGAPKRRMFVVTDSDRRP